MRNEPNPEPKLATETENGPSERTTPTEGKKKKKKKKKEHRTFDILGGDAKPKPDVGGPAVPHVHPVHR